MKKQDISIKKLVIVILVVVSISAVMYFIWRPYVKEKRINNCTENALNIIRAQGSVAGYDDIIKINKLCSVGFWQDKFRNSRTEKCNFEIYNVKEYRGEYGKNQDGYIIYEGLLKNKSTQEEYLKAMIIKMYDKDRVFISDGYANINKKIGPGEQYPFKLHLSIINKEYLDDVGLIKDLYPWFTTCE